MQPPEYLVGNLDLCLCRSPVLWETDGKRKKKNIEKEEEGVRSGKGRFEPRNPLLPRLESCRAAILSTK